MDIKNITTINEYIESQPDEIKERLKKIRHVIQEAAPDATEAISYGMPTFKLFGNLVHFAGYKHHIGFYPAPDGITQFKDLLAAFKTSKGAIQFPLDKDIPYDLIAEIVKYRVEKNIESAQAKIKKSKN